MSELSRREEDDGSPWKWIAVGIGVGWLLSAMDFNLFKKSGEKPTATRSTDTLLVKVVNDTCSINGGVFAPCASVTYPKAPAKGGVATVDGTAGQHGIVSQIVQVLRDNGWSVSLAGGGN